MRNHIFFERTCLRGLLNGLLALIVCGVATLSGAASAQVGNLSLYVSHTGVGQVPGSTYGLEYKCGATAPVTLTIAADTYTYVNTIPENTDCEVSLMSRPALLANHIYDPAVSTIAPNGGGAVLSNCLSAPVGALACKKVTIAAGATQQLLVNITSRLLATSLTSSLPNAIVGMPITLTATMNVGAAVGSINFRTAGGGASLPGCSAVTLAGNSATCSLSSAVPGVFNLEAAYLPGNYAAETSAPITQSIRACDLDIDASGSVRATTDGLLVLRRLLNLSGAAMVGNGMESAPTAKRTSDVAIAAWIDAHRNAGVNLPLDLDGDGAVDAATDGLLLLRTMLGFSGTAVTDNALGAGTKTRGTWSLIRAHLVDVCQLPLAP